MSAFALADIPPDTVLAGCSYANALNELYAARTPQGLAAASLVAASPGVLSGRNVLYLAMIGQAAGCGGAPRFGAYLRALPRHYDDPLWWSPAQLRALGGSNLAGGVAFKRAWLRRAWEALFPALWEAAPEAFPRGAFTWRTFLWAHSAFSSRGFPHSLSVPPGEGEAGGGGGNAPPPAPREDSDRGGGGAGGCWGDRVGGGGAPPPPPGPGGGGGGGGGGGERRAPCARGGLRQRR